MNPELEWIVAFSQGFPQDRRAVWHRLRRSHEQTFDSDPYKTSVIEPEPDMSGAAEQLKHAQQQLQLTKQYWATMKQMP